MIKENREHAYLKYRYFEVTFTYKFSYRFKTLYIYELTEIYSYEDGNCLSNHVFCMWARTTEKKLQLDNDGFSIF